MVRIEPSLDPRTTCLDFAHRWFRLISQGRSDKAFALIDEPGSCGRWFTPEEFHRIVEVDFLGPDSVFAELHPEGVVYSDPDTLEASSVGMLFGPIENREAYWLDYRMPLNSEWGDLVVKFVFRKIGLEYSYSVSIQDILPS